MLVVLGQFAVTKQPVNHVMSTTFRKLQVLPPDLQKLKVAIGFPKMASTYTLWKVDILKIRHMVQMFLSVIIPTTGLIVAYNFKHLHMKTISIINIAKSANMFYGSTLFY